VRAIRAPDALVPPRSRRRSCRSTPTLRCTSTRAPRQVGAPAAPAGTLPVPCALRTRPARACAARQRRPGLCTGLSWQRRAGSEGACQRAAAATVSWRCAAALPGVRAGRPTAAKSGLAWAQRHAQGRRSAGTAGQAGSTRPPSLHPSPALRPHRPAGRAGLTRVRSPWLLADVAWDAARERAAAIWLARELGRPLRRLAAADFAVHSLQAGAARRLFIGRNAGGAEQLSLVSDFQT